MVTIAVQDRGGTWSPGKPPNVRSDPGEWTSVAWFLDIGDC